ncbi:MAG: hypothetical protein JXR73_04875, partial [Candidatus Omnitrophica bacterium]|nr:hypothetical protein [Candidatus Omnitrophota bacterium]
MQWIKDSAKTFEEIKGIVQRTQDACKNAQTSAQTGSTRLEQLLNAENPGNPLRPKDLNNGLVMAT